MARLAIGRLSLDIEAAGARDPADLGDRIAAAARLDLPRGIAEMQGSRGGELIHIRRLEIDLTTIGDILPERIGFELGRRIGRSIDRLLGEPDAATVVFASPAARLATYIAALVAGDPVDRWWFASFDGLQALARPRAITTALERDPGEARQALRLLPDTARLRLPRCLGASEARRFLAAMIGPLDAGADVAALHLAALAIEADHDDPALHALALFVEGCRGDIEVPVAAHAAAANLVAGYAAAAVAEDRQLPRRLPLHAERIAELAPLPVAARALLRRLGAEARRELERIVEQRQNKPEDVPGRTDEFLYTPCANVALLWPFVDQLPLQRVCGAAGVDVCDPRRLTTLLVLATACGPEGATVLWRDPVWRSLLMLPPDLTLRHARRLLRAAGAPAPIRADRSYKRAGRPEMRWLEAAARSLVGAELAPRLTRPARLAVRAFARRLPGFDGSSAPFVAANLLRGGGRVQIANGRIEIGIARPPLDILLSITRLGDREVQLADGRTLALGREPGE